MHIHSPNLIFTVNKISELNFPFRCFSKKSRHGLMMELRNKYQLLNFRLAPGILGLLRPTVDRLCTKLVIGSSLKFDENLSLSRISLRGPCAAKFILTNLIFPLLSFLDHFHFRWLKINRIYVGFNMSITLFSNILKWQPLSWTPFPKFMPC